MNWTTLKVLGYGGLIPFVGLGVLSILLPEPDWRLWVVKANALYGTTIVSFLGALHWGLLMGKHAAGDADCTCTADPARMGSSLNGGLEQQQNLSLVWGVTPSLVAWAAMVVLPPSHACSALAGCLAIAWVVDREVYRKIAPLQDFLKLRTHLTAGAIAGLLLSAWS